MLERLTRTWEENGDIYVSIIPCEEECLNNHVSSCECKQINLVIARLAQYEDSGLSPSEVADLAQAKAEREKPTATGQFRRIDDLEVHYKTTTLHSKKGDD